MQDERWHWCKASINGMCLRGRKCRTKKEEQPPSSSSKLLNCIQHHMKPHPWALLIAKSFFFCNCKTLQWVTSNLFWDSVCISNRFILQEVWMMGTHWAGNRPNCTLEHDSNTAEAALNLGYCCLIPLSPYSHISSFPARFGLMFSIALVPVEPEDELCPRS